MSAATKAKIAAAHRGKKLSPETRAKISAHHKAHKMSPETRRKISEALRGRRHTKKES